MMTIKQKRIYHCSTKTSVRDFLSIAKTQGYVWKSDREIDVEKDVSIYDMYEEETCFKTNTGKLSFGALSGYQQKEPEREITEFKQIPKFDKVYTCGGVRKRFLQMVYQLYNDGYKATLQGIDLSARDVIQVSNSSELTDGSPLVIAVDTEDKRIRLSTERRMSGLGFRAADVLEITIKSLPPVNSLIRIKGEDNRVYMLCSENDDLTGNVYNQDCGQKRVSPDECVVIDESEADSHETFKNIKEGDLFSYKSGIFRVVEKNPLFITADQVYCRSYLSVFTRNGEYVFFFDSNITILDENSKDCKYKVGECYKIGYTFYKIIESNSIFMTVIAAGKTASEVWTVVDFESRHPQKIDINPFNPNPTAVVLADDKLSELCEKTLDVFKDHGYTRATYDGVMAWLKKWNKAKGWLASTLRHHHGWDEKNLCVSDIFEEKRISTADKRVAALSNFSAKIYNVLNDKTLFYIITSGDAAECATSKNVTKGFKDCVEQSALGRCGAKVSIGAKFTRAIRQLCVVEGIDKTEDFEKWFAALSDEFSDITVKRRYCLSINPIDFLLMSNGNSWSSCHFLQYGNSNKCYQAGTMSYPMDMVTMIFFTIDNIKGEGEYCELPKLHRQLFMYSDKFLLQSRLYPTYTDKDYSKLTRQTVKDIMQECDGCQDATDYWGDTTFNAQRFSMRCFTHAPRIMHYPDYIYEYNINITPKSGVSLPLDDEAVNRFELPEIGGTIVCPSCGKEHTYNTHCCYCGNCD